MKIFNSREKEFRCPTGAVPSGTNIHFRIVLSRDMGCTGAFLSVKDDMYGDTINYGMFWAGMVGDDHEQWVCDVQVENTGLYW